MIDLHSHVLPGIDDGPPHPQGSSELIAAAAADGTRTLAATPHIRSDFPGVTLYELAGSCEVLMSSSPSSARVDIVPAGEVDLRWAQGASLQELRLASYGQRGSDLLVETPYAPLVPSFEDLLFRISVRGFRILLAHPEQNPSFHNNPGRLTELVRRGVMLQVTARSLAGVSVGSRVSRFALSLVDEGLAHVIASDAHSAGPFRPPLLSPGVAAAARVAPARATWMVTDAPAAILAGDPLPPPPNGVSGGSRRHRPRAAGLGARRFRRRQ